MTARCAACHEEWPLAELTRVEHRTNGSRWYVCRPQTLRGCFTRGVGPRFQHAIQPAAVAAVSGPRAGVGPPGSAPALPYHHPG